MNVIPNTATLANVSRAGGARPAEVPAHGGRVVQRLLSDANALAVLVFRASGLPKISIDGGTASEAEPIATGALTPLEGFVGRDGDDSVLANMRLSPESGRARLAETDAATAGAEATKESDGGSHVQA